MSKTITLDDATYAALLAALQGGSTSTPESNPTSPPPVVTPPTQPPSSTPAWVAPPACFGRGQIKTAASWLKGSGSFYSYSPLNDGNVWLIGFTVGDTKEGSLATGEYQGPATMRNWALVRNRDEVVIAAGFNRQAPAFQFGVPQRLNGKIQLDVGERYTFAIWNAARGASSPMVGQFYFA